MLVRASTIPCFLDRSLIEPDCDIHKRIGAVLTKAVEPNMVVAGTLSDNACQMASLSGAHIDHQSLGGVAGGWTAGDSSPGGTSGGTGWCRRFIGLEVGTVVTDNSREYCGKDTHPYELYLAPNDIDHRRTKVGRPQTNGYVERFNRTALDEFFRKAFREYT